VPFPIWGISNLTRRVYKTGFATNQQAYEENVFPLFKSLDRLEKILQNRRYLIGDAVTEAGKFRRKANADPFDIRLFTTIVRFDVAYKDGFRCNIGSIRHDYPALNRWLRMLYWAEDDSFRKWTNFTHVIVPVTGLTIRLKRDITPVRREVQLVWFLRDQSQIL